MEADVNMVDECVSKPKGSGVLFTLMGLQGDMRPPANETKGKFAL